MTRDREEPGEEPGFDVILERLQSVVERLETGNLSLEESLAAYEQGVGLARRGHTLLDNAERRVEVLVRAGPGGIETVPLDGSGGPGGPDSNEGSAGAGDGGGGESGGGGSRG